MGVQRVTAIRTEEAERLARMVALMDVFDAMVAAKDVVSASAAQREFALEAGLLAKEWKQVLALPGADPAAVAEYDRVRAEYLAMAKARAG